MPIKLCLCLLGAGLWVIGFPGYVMAMAFDLGLGLGCCADGIWEKCWSAASPHLYGFLLVEWELSFPCSWDPRAVGASAKAEERNLEIHSPASFLVDGHLSSGLPYSSLKCIAIYMAGTQAMCRAIHSSILQSLIS